MRAPDRSSEFERVGAAMRGADGESGWQEGGSRGRAERERPGGRAGGEVIGGRSGLSASMGGPRALLLAFFYRMQDRPWLAFLIVIFLSFIILVRIVTRYLLSVVYAGE